MKLRCIAVDDEKFALDLLADNISRVPYIELIGVCRNAPEAAVYIKEGKVDLVFIDIQMPGLSGMQFIKSLVRKPLVVFVTAYEHFALQAFDADAIDYLVKPVTFERFLQACNKALLFYDSSRQTGTPNGSRETEYIFVNVEYNLVKIALREVQYIEGLKDYVRICFSNNEKPILTKLTMKAVDELLSGSGFIRIHKSYIIAIAAISVVKKDSVLLLKNVVELPVGNNYRPQLIEITRK